MRVTSQYRRVLTDLFIVCVFVQMLWWGMDKTLEELFCAIHWLATLTGILWMHSMPRLGGQNIWAEGNAMVNWVVQGAVQHDISPW